MKTYALAMAGAGIPVFPLQGKRPIPGSHGFHDATTDRNTILDLWAQYPLANIGMPVLPGTVAIDVDPRSGGEEGMAQLQSQGMTMPDTTISISGRGDGGRHYFLKVPEGGYADRNLPEGIDIRVGGKHYVVAPPSLHPETGQPYWWANTTPIAECPRWLLDAIRPTIKRPEAPVINTENNGSALIKFVLDLQEGQRNHGYFWAVCEALKDNIWGAIKHDLKQAAQSIGLTEHEVEATSASAERRMTQ